MFELSGYSQNQTYSRKPERALEAMRVIGLNAVKQRNVKSFRMQRDTILHDYFADYKMEIVLKELIANHKIPEWFWHMLMDTNSKGVGETVKALSILKIFYTRKG